MTLPNWIVKLAATRADKDCRDCDGEGVIDVAYGDRREDVLCACVRSPFNEWPRNPWADEGQSDARELARDRW